MNTLPFFTTLTLSNCDMLFPLGWFVGLYAFLVSRIYIHRDAEIAELIFDQRFYLIPIQAGHAASQTRQCNAADFFILHKGAQSVQRVIYMAERGMPGFAAVIVSGILREQIDDVTAIGTHPGPHPARLGMLGPAEVTEVLVHRGHALAQLQSQAMVKIIVRRDTLRDGFRTAKQNVSAQFVNHAVLIRVYLRLRKFAAMRRRNAFSLMKPAASF